MAFGAGPCSSFMYSAPVIGSPCSRNDRKSAKYKILFNLVALNFGSSLHFAAIYSINSLRRKVVDHYRHRVVPKRAPNLASFTERDLQLVNTIIEELWGRTANEVSDASHGIAWQVAHIQDSIPYEAALLSDEALTPDDVQWAEEQIAAYEGHIGRPDHPGK